MDKCLCPLFENLAVATASFLDTSAFSSSGRCSQEPSSAPSSDHGTASPPHPDHIKSIRHYLLLALMRYYREEGDSENWQTRHDQLSKELGQLSPQHKAHFYYEKSLCALFDMHLPNLQRTLAEWPTNYEVPFCEAKRAGLLAEAGAVSDALRIAQRSLHVIRSQLPETRQITDYSLLSQESYVMVLLRYLQRAEAFRQGQFAANPETQARYSDRWNELKQYMSDPWTEIELLERSLEVEYVKRSSTVERKAFDIGVVTRSVGLAWIDDATREALTGYQLLRLFEDAGLPFHIPGGNFSTKAARGAVIRISEHSPHWAITTAVRTADEKSVDHLFDRTRIAHWARSYNDKMVERYLAWDRRNSPYLKAHSPLYDTNIAVSFARIMPDVLSRLCCKSSPDSKHLVLRFLHRAYRLGNNTPYRRIDRLTHRLLNSFSVRERLAIIPQLAEFPIPDNLIPPLEHEMRNPLVYLRVPDDSLYGPDMPRIPDATVTALLQAAADDRPGTRHWALQSLQILHSFGVLNSCQSHEFAEALWKHTDDSGFPSQPTQSKFLFLELPHPPIVDVLALFKYYVRQTGFPVQDEQSGVSLHSTWEIGLVADIVGAADNVEWTDDEARDILDRLTSWWDSDKRYLRAGDETAPFGSVSLEFRRRFRGITKVIATVLRPGVPLNACRRSAVLSLIAQMRSHGLPTLQAEAAIVHMFPDMTHDVVRRIDDAMSSDDEDAVLDCMEAILENLKRSDPTIVGTLAQTMINGLGQMTRWVTARRVRHAIDVSAQVAREHSYLIQGEFERLTLIGLRRISEYTAAESADLDVSDKLVIREAAAALAYRLYGCYASNREEAPDEVKVWETICASEDEFDEIRNQWATIG